MILEQEFLWRLIEGQCHAEQHTAPCGKLGIRMPWVVYSTSLNSSLFSTQAQRDDTICHGGGGFGKMEVGWDGEKHT